jgi:hypothetical protein
MDTLMAAANSSGPNTLAAAQIAVPAAPRRTVVLRNSRLLCWTTMGMGLLCVFVGIFMVLVGFSEIAPIRTLGFLRGLAVVQWVLGGVGMMYFLPVAWSWGRSVLHYRVTLTDQGVDFLLGTPKHPEQLFIAWENIASIERKTAGSIREYTVLGNDGSIATFNSYTFIRAQRVARMIAERAGKPIQTQ